MASDLPIILVVAGAMAPDWEYQLKRDGTIIDLSAKTVTLVIKDNGENVTNAGHQTCTVTDAAGGIVQYAPQTADCPAAGRYTGEFTISGAGDAEPLHEKAILVARD